MKTITVYTPQELKEHFPDSFDRAYENFQSSVDYIPWMDEIMESLKEVFKQSGINLIDWSIGVYDCSYVRFDLEEDVGYLSGPRAMAWLENNLLGDLRIPWKGEKRTKVRKYGACYRPGKISPCPLTGFCFDEDFLESLQENINDGMCLQDAYSNLADVARKAMELELAYMLSEDYFLLSDHLEYTKDGYRI